MKKGQTRLNIPVTNDVVGKIDARVRSEDKGRMQTIRGKNVEAGKNVVQGRTDGRLRDRG